MSESDHQHTPREDKASSPPNAVSPTVAWAPPDWLARTLFLVGFFSVATVASNVICKFYRIEDMRELGVSAAVVVALGALVLGQTWLTRARISKPRTVLPFDLRSSQESNDAERPPTARALLIVPLIAPIALVAGATPAIIAQSFGINGMGQVVLLGLATAAASCPLYLGVLHLLRRADRD